MPRRPLAVAAALAVLAFLLLASAAAADEPEPLLLGDERFAVTATWRTAQGDAGFGVPLPLTDDTGAFWFFDEANLEVVVKTLAACPVNDRFWVFAAGLTDIAVELTIEDRLAGETWTHESPLQVPFAPVQDTAAFATCGTTAPACAIGSPAALAASPRADAGLEALALRLGTGIVAEDAIYDRLAADVARLGELRPEHPLDFEHVWAGTLHVHVPLGTTADELLGGKEWSCLADWFGLVEARRLTGDPSGEFFSLRFAHVLDLERVGRQYVERSPATGFDFSLIVAFDPFPDPAIEVPRFCAHRSGTTYHYFLADEEGEDATQRVERFVSEPGGEPVPAGEWTTGQPPPDWLPLLVECAGWTPYTFPS